MDSKREEKELSKEEKERKRNFDLESEKLINDGYQKHDLIVSIIKGNIYGPLLALIPIVLIVFAYFLVGNTFSVGKEIVRSVRYFLVIIITGTVVHELLHGITWSLFCKNHFKDIQFGVVWKALTPYCACLKPLKKFEYMIGSLMPCIVLGIIPSVISIIINYPPLLIYGCFETLFAGGDLLIDFLILKNKSDKKEKLYFDHPTECGVVLFDK